MDRNHPMRIVTSALLALTFSAAAATASTISVGVFSAGDYNTLLGGLSGNIVTEDFEGYFESNVGGVGSPFSTGVGDFQTLGGTGSGGTVNNEDNTFTGSNLNDGTQLAIRDGNVFGRVSTTAALTGVPGNDKFLDSNDTFGINWNVTLGGRAFRQILLTLTDAADTGATMTITSNDGGILQFQSQSPSNQKTVLIDFGASVTGATIWFENRRSEYGQRRTNDGFALDDIAISAVPLPASFFLLGAGIAGLGAMRRKRRTA
jgi:hypothetical protein